MNLSFFSLTVLGTQLEPWTPPEANLSGQLNGSQGLGWAEVEKLLFLFDEDPVILSLAVLYLVSFLVGLAGNGLSLRMLTQKRSRAMPSLNATRSLLINLAICDLMVVCVCMPVTAGNLVYKAWIFGDLLCRAAPFVQALSVSASILSLTVISLNRYYSVHNPLKARSFFTRTKILSTILVIWLLSSSICTPLAFMNRREEIGVGSGRPLLFPICREVWPQEELKQAYNLFLFCTLYCLPVSFNVVICYLTVRRLWGPAGALRDCGALRQSLLASRLKVRRAVAQMVIALVLLFAVTWLPIYLVDLWIEFRGRKSSRDADPSPLVLQLRGFSQWLSLTNSSLNPICYSLVGNLYRSAKKMRSTCQKKAASLLSFSPPSEKSRLSSVPEMLSCGRSVESAQREPGLARPREGRGGRSHSCRSLVQENLI